MFAAHTGGPEGKRRVGSPVSERRFIQSKPSFQACYRVCSAELSSQNSSAICLSSNRSFEKRPLNLSYSPSSQRSEDQGGQRTRLSSEKPR